MFEEFYIKVTDTSFLTQEQLTWVKEILLKIPPDEDLRGLFMEERQTENMKTITVYSSDEEAVCEIAVRIDEYLYNIGLTSKVQVDTGNIGIYISS